MFRLRTLSFPLKAKSLKISFKILWAENHSRKIYSKKSKEKNNKKLFRFKKRISLLNKIQKGISIQFHKCMWKISFFITITIFSYTRIFLLYFTYINYRLLFFFIIMRCLHICMHTLFFVHISQREFENIKFLFKARSKKNSLCSFKNQKFRRTSTRLTCMHHHLKYNEREKREKMFF